MGIDVLNMRVVSVMEVKRISKTEFSSLLNISAPILSHISSGRNKPSVDVLQKILIHYPDISAEWLLMGQGDMLKAKNINKESVTEALETIEERMKDGVNSLLGVKELIKQQIETLKQ